MPDLSMQISLAGWMLAHLQCTLQDGTLSSPSIIHPGKLFILLAGNILSSVCTVAFLRLLFFLLPAFLPPPLASSPIADGGRVLRSSPLPRLAAAAVRFVRLPAAPR